MYQIPAQRIYGQLLLNDKQQAALYLAPTADTPNTTPLFLRYALTEMGTEKPVWPAFVLDDWGNERTGLEMYRWIRTEGERFPRAEYFGYDYQWNEIQGFLRALELHVCYPTRIYPNANTPLADGYSLRHILLSHETAVTPQKLSQLPPQPPPHYPKQLLASPPLNLISASWWHIHPKQTKEFAF